MGFWIKKRAVPNRPPSSISLSATAWVETAAIGDTVATVSGVDPEGDAIVFTLLDSSGGRYTISGTDLKVAATLVQGTDSVTIRATDIHGATKDQTFSLTVASAPPATDLTISFGEFTSTGWGAHLLDYAGDGVLSIVSQVDGSSNPTTHWQMSQNAISPKGASSTYGSDPPTWNGPYTVVVTDGAFSFTVTINIESGVWTVRDHTPVVRGGRWVSDSVYSVDGYSGMAGAHGGNVTSCQLKTLLESSTMLKRGDVIKLRDGSFDRGITVTSPTSGWTTGSTGGSGNVVIRSENPDLTTDSRGRPYRGGGFRVANWVWSGSNGGADDPLPVTVKYLTFRTYEPAFINWFLYGWQPTAGTANRRSGGDVEYCRFIGNTSNYDIGLFYDGLYYRAGLTAGTIQYNRFEGLGKGCVIRGDYSGNPCTGVTVYHNDVINNYEDAFNYGQRAVSGASFKENLLVEQLYAQNNKNTPPTTVHSDFLQWLGDGSVLTTMNIGLMEKNLTSMNFDGNGSQGLFISDNKNAGTVITFAAQNNIIHSGLANGIEFDGTTPTVKWNTVLGVVGSAWNDLKIYAGKPAIGGAFENNVSNVFSVSGSPSPTITPSPNRTLNRSVPSQYTTAFPNYVNTGLYTRYQIAKAFTPADLLVASGGMKNADGTFNSALFPATSGNDVGAWNDGSVYDPLNPTWVAAHPPAYTSADT